ncbi:MAG TPA: hypothetical protein PLB02_00760 [Thermoanaerobaculia bacterium]|nr:hypothetical protein [Thermoanaerobaculia bacterium]HQR65907.1 hypothetical protein [Thermoanaerobaculia bacterium]
MRAAAALLLGGLGLLLAGASAPRGEPGPPRLLSQTGLYGKGALQVDPRHLAYSPQYPLWSDGAGKSRWISLPPGGRIDASNDDRWAFPVGTKLWKEFDFAGRKVETRMIWKASAKRWVFATYLWNEAQTDAEVAPEAGVPGYVEIAPGKRHSIPGVSDCRNCHEDERTPVLGFNPLQLSPDRDPLAPHAEPLKPGMVTLRELVGLGLLSPARPEYVTSPPRIPSENPRARALLGYFTANCGSCHRADGTLGSLGLDFRHSAAARGEAEEPGFATTVGRTGKWALPGHLQGESERIAPGSPSACVVLYRMKSRSPISQMPPLGTVLVDEEAVSLLERFVREDLAER